MRVQITKGKRQARLTKTEIRQLQQARDIIGSLAMVDPFIVADELDDILGRVDGATGLYGLAKKVVTDDPDRVVLEKPF